MTDFPYVTPIWISDEIARKLRRNLEAWREVLGNPTDEEMAAMAAAINTEAHRASCPTCGRSCECDIDG